MKANDTKMEIITEKELMTETGANSESKDKDYEAIY